LHGADSKDGDSRGDRLYFVYAARDIWADVRLVQDDDWLYGALSGNRQISLQAPEVEVFVEGCDDERSVDV